MTNRWDGIDTFATVVEIGSFSGAANSLGVSKAHVSRQISKLEERLGTRLLNRTTRQIALTRSGEGFYQRCRSLLDGLEDAEQAVMDLQASPSGLIRVTAAGMFGEKYITEASVAFMKKYPQVTMELDFSSRVIDLIHEGYDLAIRAGVLRDSSLVARLVTNRRLVVAASPAYLAAQGEPTTFGDLKHHNCLVGSLPTWRYRDSSGQHLDIRVDGNWHSNNGHALVNAALGGLGIVQLPEFYLDGYLRSGEMIEVLREYAPTDNGIWAVFPGNRHLSTKVRLYIEFLVEWFNKPKR